MSSIVYCFIKNIFALNWINLALADNNVRIFWTVIDKCPSNYPRIVLGTFPLQSIV